MYISWIFCRAWAQHPASVNAPLSTTDELRAQGYHFNVKTVAASLRCQGLRAKASRKFSPDRYRSHGPWRSVLFSRLSSAAEAA
ncbi:putative transposase for IS3 [Escherichia coli 1-182-04_S1_C3]|nr:putative transposase for IS3 [Escherichia coli 1-182-04_S1_C3]EZK28544.1 putative transposase for IS3 [Escherichia coli 1-182-04_S1_C1]KDA67422.1 putative transposase for IS3 [Escherichia coli 1-182-04_S1_C2]